MKSHTTKIHAAFALLAAGLLLSSGPAAEAQKRWVPKPPSAIDAKAEPHPQSAPRLVEIVQGISGGQPNYDIMTPNVARSTRSQLSSLQKTMTEMGALKTLVFKGREQEGGDVYDAIFERGALGVVIHVNKGNKVDDINMRSLQANPQ
jgi:DhnA family fructose-bisphosphate aldolase class Ia